MNPSRLESLVTAYTEAQAQTMIAWAGVEKIRPLLAAAESSWKEAQAAENGTKKVLDEFIRDQTKADARAINEEWACD